MEDLVIAVSVGGVVQQQKEGWPVEDQDWIGLRGKQWSRDPLTRVLN